MGTPCTRHRERAGYCLTPTDFGLMLGSSVRMIPLSISLMHTATRSCRPGKGWKKHCRHIQVRVTGCLCHWATTSPTLVYTQTNGVSIGIATITLSIGGLDPGPDRMCLQRTKEVSTACRRALCGVSPSNCVTFGMASTPVWTFWQPEISNNANQMCRTVREQQRTFVLPCDSHHPSAFSACFRSSRGQT